VAPEEECQMECQEVLLLELEEPQLMISIEIVIELIITTIPKLINKYIIWI